MESLGKWKDWHLSLLFALSTLAWFALTAALAPDLAGTDVYIFRDAGWNLGAYGSFESAALVYSHDLAPHFFAHYTPLMPLLFAAYIKLFSGSSYAGTFFNLLLGLAAAALALHTILTLPPSRLRHVAALIIAALPVLFVTHDRPEVLGLILFLIAVRYTLRPHSHASMVGLLLALTFLAHPFAAIIAGVWCAFLLMSRVDLRTEKARALNTLVTMALAAAIPVAAVALLYWSIAPNSLIRFAQHALGAKTGLGISDSIISGHTNFTFAQAWRLGTFRGGPLLAGRYFVALMIVVLTVGLLIAYRRQLSGYGLCLSIAAALSLAVSIMAFPVQPNYIYLLAFCFPLGVLATSGRVHLPGIPWLVVLIVFMLMNLPETAVSLLQRAEQIPSYRAAEGQPAFLLAHLSSPAPIVDVEGDEYDLFKPEFHHLIQLDKANDSHHYASLAGIANCYPAYHGPADSVRPLPGVLQASDFQRIQTAPEHLWITLFGHRLMRAQWGYGCDLYIRKPASLSAGR